MSRLTRWWRFVWLAVLVSSAGCSLLNLDEYDERPCNPDETNGTPECDDLNAELPADSCGRFYCSPTGRGCVFEERRNAEACDGLDNDCDRRIDEDAPVPDDSDEHRTEPLEDLVRVSPAASDDGTLHVVLTRVEESDLAIELSHVAIDDEISDEEVAPTALCLGGAERDDQTCLIDDIAIAATSKTLAGAGFHRSTCNAGQLRVGIGSATAFDLSLGEDARARRTGAAIDVAGAMGCTVSSGCPGGFDPVVAILSPLEETHGEALVLWRAPSASDEEACRGTQDFVIAAARLPFAGDGADARFVGPVDESSSLLSAHSATGAPRLVAAGDAADGGFLAAFPSGDRIQLAFMARLAAGEAAERAPITGSIGARAASDIALVAGAVDRGWAVAYRTEVDGKHAVELRALTIDDQARVAAIGGVVTLQSGTEIVAGPTLSYAPAGFMVPASGESAGGWLVAWVESAPSDSGVASRLMVRRVAEASRAVLGDAVELAQGDLSLPFSYLKHESRTRTSLQCAFLDGEMLHVRSASCAKK